MKSYLQRIAHDSRRALPAMVSGSSSERFAGESSAQPDQSFETPFHPARNDDAGFYAPEHTASTQAVKLSGPLALDEKSPAAESFSQQIEQQKTEVNSVTEKFDTLRPPVSSQQIDRSPITNSIAAESRVARGELEIDHSNSKISGDLTGAQRLENSARGDAAVDGSTTFRSEHQYTRPHVIKPIENNSEKSLFATDSGADERNKNMQRVSTLAATARAISQLPPMSTENSVATRRESAAPRLHIGEVRITVQDEPRKAAKPKRRRSGESESRLLIRSL